MDAPCGNQKGRQNGVKFNKLEFLKLLSHVLNTDLLIFVFKEKGALSTHCCCENVTLPLYP